MNTSYVVVGTKPWNLSVFDELHDELPGKWTYIGQSEELNIETLTSIAPRYIFFLHWSWKVPKKIINEFECVCFHMTDVPYGRGGSPLQNLIHHGHQHTKLTALRMVEDYDAGPVFLKKDLSLMGSAEEIYIRSTYLSFKMIREIIEKQMIPVPQKGKPSYFKRRKPEQSEILEVSDLFLLFDFIRMLDADGYPRAFFERNGFRFEFSRAAIYNGKINADVKITTIPGNNK